MRAAVWGVAGLAAGCSAAGPEPAAPDSRTWDGPFVVDMVVIDCDSRSWRYDVWTQGWGEQVSVQIVVREAGVLLWQEAHALAEVEFGDDWAHFAVDLEQAASEADYRSGASTLVLCEAKTFVTYGFSAWDYDGALAECIGWGIDPEGEFPGCISWGQVDHD